VKATTSSVDSLTSKQLRLRTPRQQHSIPPIKT
jgi:hypothetical protein